LVLFFTKSNLKVRTRKILQSKISSVADAICFFVLNRINASGWVRAPKKRVKNPATSYEVAVAKACAIAK